MTEEWRAETKRQTLAERIKNADPPLHMSATHEGVFDRMPGDPARWEHDRWRVTLRTGGRSLTTQFRMGLGHNGERPSTALVMESLLSDAAAAENARDFRDFASEFGYSLESSADRRRAEQVYVACCRMRDRVQRLLGDRYEAWLWETESE